MALADFDFAVGFGGEGAGLEFARPGAEAHGAAHFVDAEEFAEFVNDAVRRLRIAFGGVGLFQAGDIACVFDRGALHAETDTEIRHLVFAGVLNRVDHALHAALAEASGNQNAVVAV